MVKNMMNLKQDIEAFIINNNSFRTLVRRKYQYLTLMTSFPFDPNDGQILAIFSSRFSFLRDNNQAELFQVKWQEIM